MEKKEEKNLNYDPEEVIISIRIRKVRDIE